MKLINILIFMNLVSCSQNQPQNNAINKENEVIKPFEITVINNNLGMTYDLRYVLTEKEIKIIFNEDVEVEKDSVIFSDVIQSDEILKHLSYLNIDSFKEYYENPCIEDGSQLKVKLRKDNKTKDIYLSNYYQIDIGLAIELINKSIPEKYKIWYEKDKLLKAQKECDEQMEIENGLQIK